MPEDDEVYLPPLIRQRLKELEEATKLKPLAEKTGDHRWRVSLASERVRFSYDVKQTNPGRLQFSEAITEVDGVRCKQPRDMADLARIFRDPDSQPEPVTIGPMPEAYPPERTPREVRRAYEMFVRRLGEVCTVEPGRAEPFWVIGLKLNDAAMRLHYFRANNQWRTRIQLVVSGEDRSREVRTVADAMRMMLKLKSESGTQPPGSTGSPRPAARGDTGARLHKTTIIRR